MPLRDLTKDNKTLPRYTEKFDFASRHPCTYQFVASRRATESGNMIYEIIDYAEDNDMRYKQAKDEAINVTNTNGRNGDVPVVGNETLIERLLDLDKLVRNGGRSSVPNDDIKRVRMSAMNVTQNDNYRYVCAEFAPMIVNGSKPPVSFQDVLSLKEEDREKLAEAVGLDPREFNVVPEDVEEETRDEIEYDDEDEEPEVESSTVIPTRNMWGSDDDFAVWLYAKMANRQDVADRLTAESDPTQLDSYSDIQRVLDISSNPSELTRNFAQNENIDFSPEQQNKWAQAQEIVSQYSDDDEALINLVNEMSRLEMVVNGESEDSDDSMIVDPGRDENDDEAWLDYDPDPDDDPEDIPSVLFPEEQ